MKLVLDKKFNNIILTYLIAIPFALIIGDFAINLVIYSLSFLITITLFFKKDWSFIENKTIFLFIICWVYLVLISLFIHDLSYKSIGKGTIFGFNLIFSFGLAYYASKIDFNNLKFFSYIFLALTIFIYIDLLYQFLSPEHKDLLGYPVTTIKEYTIFNQKFKLPLRLSGPFEGELVPGFYLSSMGFLSILLFFHLNKLFMKNFFLITFLIINFLFIILTGERSSIIVGLFFFIYFLLFDNKFNKKKIFQLFFIIALLIGFVSLMPTTKERFSDLSYWQSLYSKKNNIEEISYTEDLFKSFKMTDWGKHYSVAIMMIKDKPLFGHGIRSFRNVCKNYELHFTRYEDAGEPPINYKHARSINTIESGCATHPHHYILEIISETGVIFFIIFSCLIFRILKNFSKKNNNFNHLNHGTFSIFLSYLFPIRPTGAFFSSWYGSFFWILLAFVIFSYLINNRNNEKNI